MTDLLHVLTKADDALPAKIIALQSADHRVTVIDLTVPEPDYENLVKEIFKADSVQVW